MKKILLLSVINLFLTTYCFSQTTYPKIIKDSLLVITPIQLKNTNLIFLEHKFYKNKIHELEGVIKVQGDINTTLNNNLLIKESIITEKDSIIMDKTKLHYDTYLKLDAYKDFNKKLIISGVAITITLGVLLIIN